MDRVRPYYFCWLGHSSDGKTSVRGDNVAGVLDVVVAWGDANIRTDKCRNVWGNKHSINASRTKGCTFCLYGIVGQP